MPAAEVHRGALVEKLAKAGEKRCTAVIPGSAPTPKDLGYAQCAYRAGHDGLHFRGGMVWGP